MCSRSSLSLWYAASMSLACSPVAQLGADVDRSRLRLEPHHDRPAQPALPRASLSLRHRRVFSGCGGRAPHHRPLQQTVESVRGPRSHDRPSNAIAAGAIRSRRTRRRARGRHDAATRSLLGERHTCHLDPTRYRLYRLLLVRRTALRFAHCAPYCREGGIAKRPFAARQPSARSPAQGSDALDSDPCGVFYSALSRGSEQGLRERPTAPSAWTPPVSGRPSAMGARRDAAARRRRTGTRCRGLR